MFTFATGVSVGPENAALLLLTLARAVPSLYVAGETPEPPEAVRMVMDALADGMAQGVPDERLVMLIAAALDVLADYFEAPVEIDLHRCRVTNGPALLFAPAAATAGGDATRH